MEKIVSEVLRKYPKLRTIVKHSYQFSMITIGKLLNLECQRIDKYLELSKSIDNDSNYFGYYDKTPWNSLGNKILTMKVPFDDRHPKESQNAILGYYDKNLNKFIKIDITSSWNLQQGCMLQWLENSTDERVIYNKFENKKYISVIYNLKNKEKNIINYPIY